MKPNFLAIFGAFALALATAVHAGPALGAALATQIQARRNSIVEAKAQFAAHGYDAGEEALESGNRSPAGSAAWHLESGVLLYGMALEFQGRDAAAAANLATRALQQLTAAEARFSNADRATDKCMAQLIAGHIYERFGGDLLAAQKCYQAAAIADPKNQQAVFARSRLNRSLAEMAHH